MPEQPHIEQPAPDAIRMIGEGDRLAEFKEARSRLTDDVSSWLQEFADKRDGGEDLIPGLQTSAEPRITQTDLGPSGNQMRAIGETTSEGVSLSGDGKTTPFVFQQVQTNPTSGIVEVTEVRGTDPMSAQIYGDEYDSSRQSEIVASFGVRELASDATERYFNFAINGAGQISREYLRDDGVNVRESLNTPQDIQAAQLAFESITTAVSS